MTALNLKLNSGGFEDMAVIYKDNVAINAFIRSGLVLEVTPYLGMPDKYPNLAKIHKEIVDYCRSDDGKLWHIPAGMRRKWMTMAGLGFGSLVGKN